MKPAASFALVALAASNLVAASRVSNRVPGAFVVELDSSAHLASLGARDLEARTPHDAFYNHLRKRGVPWTVRQSYHNDGLFVGTSIQLENEEDAFELADAPGVVAVRPVNLYPMPKPVHAQQATPGTVPPDAQSSHKLIAVDKLHAEGVFGKGIKVGILDTGIDYLHPNLGAGFGEGKKVGGGYDFAGDDYTGRNTPVPDSDPMDCAGHGTHVAGIVAASGPNEYNISGVASEATLYGYRIFGCEGFTSDDLIIAALLRGVNDTVDILSMSLGGSDGWTENAAAVVASRIASQGIVVTISAGNDGEAGSWYTSSPGNALNAISVASIDNLDFPVRTAYVGNATHDPIAYSSLKPYGIAGPRPIWVLTNSTTKVDDGCDPFPEDTPDLSEYIVIIRRGTCFFVTKVENAVKYNATAVLIYNNVAGIGSLPDLAINASAMISADDGAYLVNQYFSGNRNLTLTFPPSAPPLNFPNPTGGLVSAFSSYGPTNDMYMKPAIAAPGGQILSTVPRDLDSFAVYSGTSMSCPATAGVAALILEVRGNKEVTALSVRDLLQTTANPIAKNKTDGAPWASVAQQGSGLINAWLAARTKAIIAPAQLLLNDSANFVGEHTITIGNTDTTDRVFTLRHVPAAGLESVQPGSIIPSIGPVPVNTVQATVALSATSVSVGAGGVTGVSVTFTRPPNDPVYSVYSGWIEITGGNETYRVTYLGVAGSLKEKKIIDDTDEFSETILPGIALNGTFVSGSTPSSFNFESNDTSPELVWRLAFGTPKANFDLVSAGFSLNGSATSKREVESFWFPTQAPGGSFSDVPILGNLGEVRYLARNSLDPEDQYNVTIPNKFANGTTIPNGSYKVLFRALKVTGDPALQSDYESWLSPTLVFNYTAPNPVVTTSATPTATVTTQAARQTLARRMF